MVNSTLGANNAPTRFSLSLPSTADSSRNSSPAPGLRRKYNAKQGSELDPGLDESPGQMPVDVYDTILPPWRARIRKMVVKRVEKESETIANMQKYIRTPFWDAYFVYTSSLGTHTFFMAALPTLYFFGYDEFGTSLIVILAFGVYFTSVIKDLVCSPRPFAPPVTRLSIGSHHLEYGLPSTHSTNSVSIALFLFAIVYQLTYPSSSHSNISTEPTLSPQTFSFITSFLCIYAFSIVFGRLYTAMHSFTDCAIGGFLGALIWWAETSWTGIPIRLLSPSTPFHPTTVLINILQFLNIGDPLPSTALSSPTPLGVIIQLGHGLGLGRSLCSWVKNGGWEVPLILIPLCLLAVNQHPQPVDDCPCFEDAIAFGSVVLGILLGKWAVSKLGIPSFSGIMPGSGWQHSSDNGWIQVPRQWDDILVWWFLAILKLVFGILAIFTWRLIAKSALRLVLPPTFRLLAKAFRLPKRRFYTPATEYISVPSEFSKEGGVFHTIPSVIDLPTGSGMGVVDGIANGNGNGTGIKGRGKDVKLRVSGLMAKDQPGNGEMQEKDKEGEPITHYDADVLTKLVVYSGIGIMASLTLPALYDYLGWGLSSWPS